jgi:hypothetical protein
MSDEEPTEEELAEAEALARALERSSAGSDLPEDAFEAAALVRYSLDGGELPIDRKSAIWSEVVEKARVPEPKAKPGFASWLKWLVPSLSLATAAAIAIAIVIGDRAPGLLPEPRAELLEAQARAASGEAAAAAELERRMRTYRTDLYAALQDRYR